MNSQISVIMPVYGRTQFVYNALQSVYSQTVGSWRLLIADDCSDERTTNLLYSQIRDERVKIVRRSKNVGLFANLNRAHYEAETDWQLILCSDDMLLPNAIETLSQCILKYPRSSVVLSSFVSIDRKGNELFDVNGMFYDYFATTTREFEPCSLLEPLLRYGSINGNISGMLINRKILTSIGMWREDWCQAADWEWIVRATENYTVLVNRQPIAQVRVHSEQLSVSNRKKRIDVREILEVLEMLVENPHLRSLRSRRLLAAHHAQYLLWNILKEVRISNLKEVIAQIMIIHKKVGLLITLRALISSLPQRIMLIGKNRPLKPPTL